MSYHPNPLKWVGIHAHVFNKKHPANIKELFVLKRCWNECAEKGFMKRIEDNFHAIMPKIINNALNLTLLPDELKASNQIITEYFLLLLVRYKFSNPDYINVIDPRITNKGSILQNVHEDDLTQEKKQKQEQKENLESKGVHWVEPYGTNTGVINRASWTGLLDPRPGSW